MDLTLYRITSSGKGFQDGHLGTEYHSSLLTEPDLPMELVHRSIVDRELGLWGREVLIVTGQIWS